MCYLFHQRSTVTPNTKNKNTHALPVSPSRSRFFLYQILITPLTRPVPPIPSPCTQHMMLSPSNTPSAHHHPTSGTISPSPHNTHSHHDHHLHRAPPTAKQQLEAANIAHFDAHSADYDTQHPEAHELALRLARALRRVLPLDEDTTCVLDYACGSGTVPSASASVPRAACQLEKKKNSDSYIQDRSRVRWRRTSRAL